MDLPSVNMSTFTELFLLSIHSFLNVHGITYTDGSIISKRYFKVFLLLSLHYSPVYFPTFSKYQAFLNVDSIHLFDEIVEIRFVDRDDKNIRNLSLTKYENFGAVEKHIKSSNFKSVSNYIG